MIPSEKEERVKIIRYMLDGLKIAETSDWESEFLDSIEEQFGVKGTLSDRQCEKLEQIYDKLVQ